MSSGIENVDKKGYCVLYFALFIILLFATIYGVYQGNWNSLN